MVAPQLWDVWIAPFPYSDRLAEKRRPVLVISANRLFQEHGLAWVAMITSTRINRWSTDFEISDLASAGLPIQSRVRIAKIATLEPSRLIQLLGQLSLTDRRRARESLKGFLAL